jgi:hypothetical protein
MDANNSQKRGNSSVDPKGAAAHIIMFWVLACMALAVFTPAVLLPVWVENEEIRAQKEDLAASVSDLESRVENNQACIEALLADPAVNERIIRRELNYRPENEKVVQWSPEAVGPVRIETCGKDVCSREPVQSDPQPVWVATIRPWLPDWPWRALFVKSPNREVLLILAGAALVAAFVLYAPKPRT